MNSLIDGYTWLLQPAITLGWPISYLELILLVFNVGGVYLAARTNVLTAPVCLVAITAYMMFCISCNFYSEFFLQIYFFIANIWLWISWGTKSTSNTKPTYMGVYEYTLVLGMWVFGTWMLGSNIDSIFTLFATSITAFVAMFTEVAVYQHTPASYPYVDAFTTIGQVIAMILMVRRFVENWWIWIIIDVVSIPMFALKGGYGVSLMFILFLVPAIYGAIRWHKLAK